eukprot:GGOE01000987.1.p1 GENE.GGOE01000987.1~~GGOE01000987.1.p1  ORF type:complete len:669 (-),score=152.23 GGOE01000987.1:270-2072(-)
MSTWYVRTATADPFLAFDMAEPLPPQEETRTLDLAMAPHCKGTAVQQVLYLDRQSRLSFRAISVQAGGSGSTIRVIWQRREVCRFSDVSLNPLHCRVQAKGFHRIVFTRIKDVQVHITGARYVASNALCGDLCERQVQAAWRTVAHPILLLPRNPICLNGSHGADTFPLEVARVELLRPWGTIFLIGLGLQLTFQVLVALAVFLCTRCRHSKESDAVPLHSCAAPRDYQTFHVGEVTPSLPVMFPEESVKYLLVFILTGWLGLHRMYRIAQHHPMDSTTLLLALVACLLLGPVFFAQDGFCFADFLREEEVSLLGPDPEVLNHLELRLLPPTGVNIAEQPARHFSYMVFLLPYYWVIMTRLTELLHCVDMFSQVTSALLWASGALLAMWLLFPTSIVIASRSHDVVLVVRQWFCVLQVWGVRRSIFVALGGQLDWGANVIHMKLRGVHPDQLMSRSVRLLWTPAAVLHFLPLLPHLLPRFPPWVDVFPAVCGQPAPPHRFPLLHWDAWMVVVQYLDMSSAARLAVTAQAFVAIFDHEAFWRQRLLDAARERWPGVSPKTQVFLLHMARREELRDCPVVTTGLVPFPTTTSVWHLQLGGEG